jgi:hypothetical protein
MAVNLPIVNLSQATFECTFGRGCDGICCNEGRPPVEEKEDNQIRAHLDRFLPELRPEARALIRKKGYLSSRCKDGLPTLRVAGGSCVFFNRGCVLHKVGAAEGDKYRYKPVWCAVFPLDVDDRGNWYVRQHGHSGEEWDLFCLAPHTSCTPAAESLREEIVLAERCVSNSITAASQRA